MKLTLQLGPDKGSASSSLMWTKAGNLFIIQGEKKRKQKAQKRHYGLAMRDELFNEPQSEEFYGLSTVEKVAIFTYKMFLVFLDS